MNTFLIIILSILAEYTIAYFLIRSAIFKCNSESDIQTLHVIFFFPILNIITPIIVSIISVGAYKFFRIKK